MRITEETIERIKQENDIVDIISETVKLKRSGRNYMGLCPFHNEKSPSFSVSQDKQIYKCFGCGEAGNVLTFVMKNRNLNFIEACKVLAEKANIRLDLGNGEESKVVKKKELLYKVNVEAARYFFSNLQRDKISKEYFTNRGIKEITIKRFGLGYAKDGWQNLRTHLKRKGFNDELMLEAGLVLKSQKGTIYDRFRNRVMFPVFNSKGNVIGFGGRVLDDSKPKYLNSPETLVFQKGTNLYGLNFAIKHKNEERYFIIVEGYMDLISLHQYGITNVVASLGTALTTNQARLLKRYADKVIISYDADFAGQTATLRGLEILKEAGFDVRVLQIPQGKDPDEFVRSNGRDAFLKLVNKAESLISYRLKKAKDGIDFKDKTSLIEYGNRVAEILANLNPVEKDIYVKSISEDTGIKEQSLYDLISMTKNTKSEDFMNKKEEFGTKLYVEPGYVKAEKSLIKLMLDEDYYNEIIENISSDDLNSKAHAKIFNLIKESKDKGLENTNLHVEAGCDDVDSSKEWVKIKEFQVLKAEDKHRLILDYIKQIKNFKLTKQLDILRKKLKELENNGLIEESIKVALELNKINDALKKGERD
ncbi:DNA primase [Clostridium baratii]|uniref:DNA primase n=1 Tax=Clostridium baratii TaxID=1561 RepID=A0A174PKE0_9CLOT|nr:DNA primase [Clostridium baratii]OPF51980.1 DNA primase [Clostridium baratii]OPF53624.1 DNA primase [Clostridium baratii]OPF56443.1 DNA primase [Clostridium baratii]OPF60671.1 DNA primase [Clostridium baratii]CUP61443.1 DNA primase DnaG [Clostridium baratii]